MGATAVLATIMVAFLALIIAMRYRHRSRDEAALRAMFGPHSGLIGKDFDYMAELAGPPNFYGSMDHGRDVAQWRVGRVMAEVWFQNGVCTDVEVREVA